MCTSRCLPRQSCSRYRGAPGKEAVRCVQHTHTWIGHRYWHLWLAHPAGHSPVGLCAAARVGLDRSRNGWGN